MALTWEGKSQIRDRICDCILERTRELVHHVHEEAKLSKTVIASSPSMPPGILIDDL